MNIKEKICGNCIHFFQSGMAMEMSDGNAGYCLLIRNSKNIRIKNKNAKSIVSISDTCLKFEE